MFRYIYHINVTNIEVLCLVSRTTLFLFSSSCFFCTMQTPEAYIRRIRSAVRYRFRFDVFILSEYEFSISQQTILHGWTYDHNRLTICNFYFLTRKSFLPQWSIIFLHVNYYILSYSGQREARVRETKNIDIRWSMIGQYRFVDYE